MAGRLSASTVLLLLVPLLVFVTLFASPDRAEAVSWKMSYTNSLSDTTPGAHGDVLSDLYIYQGSSNYGKLITTTAPPEWQVATDRELPNGASVGAILALTTLSISGGACASSVVVSIPFFKATNNIENTAEWIGDGTNLTTDNNNNGLPEAIDKYPSYLNDLYYNLKPRIRYYGFSNAVSGAPPSQLNFTVFSPGQFGGDLPAPAGYPAFPNPERGVSDSYGYLNYVQLDNPFQNAPSAITEFCTPLRTTTDLWGLTRGEGEVKTRCGNSLDDDGDGKVNDGCSARCGDGESSPCPAETSTDCANAVDDDGDGWVNDGCPFVPDLAGTEGTGPPELTAFCSNQCVNTTDDDVIDAGEGALGSATRRVNDGCPAVGAAETNCADSKDDDADGWVNDGCPQAGGSAEVDLTNADNDGDGFADDGCIVITDYCTNMIDDDLDGAVDEDCGLVRATNPAASKGLVVNNVPGNTHLFRAYGQSYYDEDDDGINNLEDSCPWTADRTVAAGDTSRELWAGPDGDVATLGDNECGTGTVDTDGYPITGFTGDSVDDDADCPNPGASCTLAVALGGCKGYCDDGCPFSGVNTKERDDDEDGLGHACDDDDTTADTDEDDDGYHNVQDNCPKVANGPAQAAVAGVGDQDDTDGDRCDETPGSALNDDPGDDSVVNDGCPTRWSPGQAGLIGNAETSGSGWCTDTLDNDNDGYVNDGCPMVGSVSESCVTVGNGPCEDSIGDACDTHPKTQDGSFAASIAVTAVCLGTDADGDGWCNDIDPNDTDATKTPEDTRVEYKVAGGSTLFTTNDVCGDHEWYVTGSDLLGGGAKIDNDKDGTANPAGGLCGDIASDDDDDGVMDVLDKCGKTGTSLVYNPEQLDTDKDGAGDACDSDDDNDYFSDVDEWRRATDQKNWNDPLNYDLTYDIGDARVNTGDVLRYGAAGILKPNAVGRYVWLLQSKTQSWKYDIINSTGLAQDDLEIVFSDLVTIIYAYDDQGGVWTCAPKKYTGYAETRWHCDRASGTLSSGHVLSVVSQSEAKKNVTSFTLE